MKRGTWFVVASATMTAGALLALAQERSGETHSDRAKDDSAIREASQSLAAAFEKGDAKAIAAFWTEEGEFISDDGNVIRGRDALAKAYTGFFAKRQHVKAEAKTQDVRFLGKDLGVEDGTFTVRAADAPAESTRYSTLYLREDGRWRIALLKEQSDRSVETPELSDISWLIGTWQSEGADGHARVTYEWTDNKRFLKATYSIKSKKPGAKATSGTEMIGVDPARGIIRGWTFNDAGDFGETSWTWDNGRWEIEAVGTQGDGSHSTALNLLTRSGNDAFTWRSVQRTIDGAPLPDLPAVKVNRVQKTDRPDGK